MSNLHRIKWIDGKIRNNNYPNCRKICEEFEISNRQALRDIEYLRDSLNAPVQYSQKYRGYYYTEETYSIPFNMVTQKEGLLIGKVIQDYKGKEKNQIEHLSSFFTQLNDNRNNNKKITKVISEGIEEGLKLEVEYINSRNILCSSIVKPHSLENTGRDRYFKGFLEPGSYFLSIEIADIKSVKLTNQSFNKYSPSILHTTKKMTPYKSRVEFETYFNPIDYDYPATTNKNVVEFSFESSEDFLTYLLKKGLSFKILSPEWLKSKLVRKLQKILKNNLP